MRKLIIATLALLLTTPSLLGASQAPGLSADLTLAPEAWNQQDPADSLYRAARDAMNRGEYVAAADMFRRIWERHARSTYAPDAPYWEAFSRYRTNQTRDLERALESLDIQKQRYADAPSRQNGDAEALAARIRGMLAQRGDDRAAREVVEAASQAAALVSAGMPLQEGAALAREQGAVVRSQAALAREQAAVVREQTAVVRDQARAAREAVRPTGAADVPPECREQIETQTAALNALMQMNAERAMPILTRVMQRRDTCSPPIRRQAIYVISQRTTPETVDVMLEAARNDPDPDVRRQAVFWLGHVRDERAVAVLTGFALEADDARLREHALFALSQHRSPQARQVLRRVAQDGRAPTTLRGQAIFWLGQSGGDEDAAFLRGLFGRVGDASLDERILYAASQSRAPDNAAWLLGVAANPQVEMNLRKQAVFWAGQAGAEPGQIGALYDRFEDRDMKQRILFALSQSRGSDGVDILIRIARTETDPRLRQQAIFWLGQSNDPRAADILMRLLVDTTGGR